MIYALIAVGAATLYLRAPFPIWKSYLTVLRNVALSREIDLHPKIKMIGFLLSDLVAFPFLALAWYLDRFVVRPSGGGVQPAPVCLVGQPRSGTTFIHRTLSHCPHFHSVRHCEMRYPFVWLWKCLRFLGLERRVHGLDYWPKTDVGALASKLHSHKLGDYEEHGIFLEERMYHHFFVFRRFPIPRLLEKIADFSGLTASETKKLHETFEEVVWKSQYLNGNLNKPVLLKENESVEFYEDIYRRQPEARFIFVVRDPDLSISSYQTLSVNSTHAKTGIDPTTIAGWQEANDRFRLDECNRMMALYAKLPANRKILVSYDRFVADIEGTTTALLNWLQVTVDSGFAGYLARLGQNQTSRDKGYENVPHQIDGLGRYKEFVQIAQAAPTFSSAEFEPAE